MLTMTEQTGLGKLGTHKLNTAANNVHQRGMISENKTAETTCQPLALSCFTRRSGGHVHTRMVKQTFNVSPRMPRTSTGLRPHRSDRMP